MKKAIRKNGGAIPRVRESAQTIWLAGLGALASARDGGTRMFRTFVRRGEELDRLNRTQVRKLLARAEDLGEEARAALGTRVRAPLDKGVTMALHKLGVPTRTEILTLTRRGRALTRAVEKKQRRPAARRPAAHRAAATPAA